MYGIFSPALCFGLGTHYFFGKVFLTGNVLIIPSVLYSLYALASSVELDDDGMALGLCKIILGIKGHMPARAT